LPFSPNNLFTTTSSQQPLHNNLLTTTLIMQAKRLSIFERIAHLEEQGDEVIFQLMEEISREEVAAEFILAVKYINDSNESTTVIAPDRMQIGER
jgi:hypothetical protein